MPRSVLALVLLLVASIGPGAAEVGNTAYVLDIKGAIGPATADYIERGLDKARAQNARLVILRMDTPGGLSTSMRQIIKAILSSRVPVATYVWPSGARAASAGTYILYASHVAAMAPGTNLGAATPVAIAPPMPGRPGSRPDRPDKKGDTKDKKSKKPGPGDSGAAKKDAMSAKAIEDAVAYIRSLAQMRGRNVEWAEKAVREAASLSAKDALAANVIDVMARDVDELLTVIDGRTVTVIKTKRKISTKGLTLVTLKPDWRTELLATITNPNVAYILMLLGIYGLAFEFMNPGAVVPGVIGGISLLLALYALQLLPINYAGLGLLLLGIALMVAEAFVPSFGILGLGGIVAFVIGSFLLFDTDVAEFALSWAVIGAVAAVSAGFFMVVLAMVFKSRRRPVVSGAEQMVGSAGQVIDWKGDSGHVRTQGEVWSATAKAPLKKGQRVRVKALHGLTVEVAPGEEDQDADA